MPLPAGLKFWDPTVILGPAACRAKPWWWPKLLPRSVQRWCTSMWTWRSATQKWPTHSCSRTRDLFGVWTCFNYLHKNVDLQSLAFGRNTLSVPSPEMDCKLPFLFDLEVWTSNLSWWNPKRGRPNYCVPPGFLQTTDSDVVFDSQKKLPNKTPSDRYYLRHRTHSSLAQHSAPLSPQQIRCEPTFWENWPVNNLNKSTKCETCWVWIMGYCTNLWIIPNLLPNLYGTCLPLPTLASTVRLVSDEERVTRVEPWC